MGKAARARRGAAPAGRGAHSAAAPDLEAAAADLRAAAAAAAAARAVRDGFVIEALRDGQTVADVARAAGISRQAVMKIRDR